MNLKSLSSEIESDDFFARLAIASDARLFLKFARKFEVTLSLLKAVREDEEAQLFFAKRILELLQLEYDAEYTRPSDTALAIYVWALGDVQSRFARALATEVAQSSNLWWAAQIARRVLRPGYGYANANQGTVTHSASGGALESFKNAVAHTAYTDLVCSTLLAPKVNDFFIAVR
jgi:hypothetical protein